MDVDKEEKENEGCLQILSLKEWKIHHHQQQQ